MALGWKSSRLASVLKVDEREWKPESIQVLEEEDSSRKAKPDLKD